MLRERELEEVPPQQFEHQPIGAFVRAKPLLEAFNASYTSRAGGFLRQPGLNLLLRSAPSRALRVSL